MLRSGNHARLRLSLDSLLYFTQNSRRATQTSEQPNKLIDLNCRPRRRAPLIRHTPSCRRNVTRHHQKPRDNAALGRRPSPFLHPFLWACCSLRLQTREPTPEARELGGPAPTSLAPHAVPFVMLRKRCPFVGSTMQTTPHGQRSVSPNSRLPDRVTTKKEEEGGLRHGTRRVKSETCMEHQK